MHGLKTLEKMNKKAAEVKAVKVKMAKGIVKVVGLYVGSIFGLTILLTVLFMVVS